MRRLFLLIAVGAMCFGCVSERKVYKWLNNNPKSAAEYAAVKFPPKTVQGETKVIKVVDSVEKIVTLRDTVICPDSTKIIVDKDIRYVIQKEYLQRVDTVENTAAVEKERYRANEAEREVAVKDGALVGEKEKAKARLYWIIGLSLSCAALLVLLFKR